MLRVGVIGGGYGRTVHLPALARLRDVAVTTVADAGSGRVAAAAPDATYFPSWQAMLEHAEIDALSVAVPPALHAAIVTAALRHRLHVLCEKPFGRDVAQASAMAELPPGLVGAIGYQFRYEPGLRTLRGVLAARRIGRLRRIAITWATSGRADPRRPWGFQHDAAAGGGVIEGFLCHCLDYVLWLTGAGERRIWARSDILVGHRPDAQGATRAVTAEDSVDAVLELTDAIVVTMSVTNCQPGRDVHRIELSGDGGWAELHQSVPGGPQRLTVIAAETTTDWLPASPPGLDSRLSAFAQLAADFVAAIGGAPAIDLPRFADGLRVRRILAGLRESLATGAWHDCL